MLKKENFPAALKIMNFIDTDGIFKKIFAPNIIMSADFANNKLCYPSQIKNHDRNTILSNKYKENLVVFECVNRLLEKGYKPEDIEKLLKDGNDES